MSVESSLIANALYRAAKRWLDIDYPVRVDAIERSLEAPNRFTESAVNFAVNQQMALLTINNLIPWESRLLAGSKSIQEIGVLNAGNIPFVELQDFLAIVLSGRAYYGTVSSKSPALFPAFLCELLEEVPDLRADIASLETVLDSCEAVIASGSDETISKLSARVVQGGVAPERCWFRGNRVSVAVLDGRERKDQLLALAEDVLLHEGQGCRNVGLVFAPEEMKIDPVLEAFAAFRGTFMAHDATKGTLKMQQAFLGALNSAHAFAEDHQFLISRGEALVQQPCHLRWVTYGKIDEVGEWLRSNKSVIQSVFSDSRLASMLGGAEKLGTAQRPKVDWCPDDRSHINYFEGIEAVS